MSQDVELTNSLWDQMFSAQQRHVILMDELERTRREIAVTYVRLQFLTRTMAFSVKDPSTLGAISGSIDPMGSLSG